MTDSEHRFTPTVPEPAKTRFRPDHVAGWLDLVGHGLSELAPRLHRTHRQIADSVFNRVEALAPGAPVVQITRSVHHLITDLAYTSVGLGGAGLSQLARLQYRPLTAPEQHVVAAAPRLPAQLPEKGALTNSGT